MTPRRAVVLVDGEHYPPVIRAALQSLAEQGTTALAALFLGGTEKVVERGADVDLGVPAEWVASSGGPAPDIAVAGAHLTRLVAEHRPDVVVDLSDEPVLDARRRLQLASHVLLAGVAYEGADFVLAPPARPRLTRRSTIAVIGTGKRTGKTAVAGEVARCLRAGGREPVIVAMGRGGPPEPVIVRAGARLDPAVLLAVADAGGHAASDFYEDAVTSGAATVGARRCGGGLAGAVGYSNVAMAVATAESLPGDLLVVEGSGSAIPPVHADVTVLVVPADCDPELLGGYLGSYRVLLADLIVVTMCESPRGVPEKVDAVTETLRSISRRTPVLRTVLRPVPLGPVDGDRVFFATTAPATVGASLVDALEERHGCEVVATSHRLADRPALISDLAAAPPFDVLLVELKAAAIDVAVRSAARAGARVVFCDNRPIIVGAHEATGDATGLQDAVVALTRLADERATAR